MDAKKSKRFVKIQQTLPDNVMVKLLQKGKVTYKQKKYSIYRVKNLHKSNI
jgi:hypothetical protein